MVKWLINQLLTKAKLRIYTSSEARGRRLGGHNIQGVGDSFIILEVSWSGAVIFEGHWQTS